MIISKNRIYKILISLIVSLCAGLVIYYRPWYPGFKVSVNEATIVSLEKSNGEHIDIKLDPPAGASYFSFYAVKYLSARNSKSEPVKLVPEYFDNIPASQRFMPIIRESVIIVSTLLFFFIWMMLENFSPHIFTRKYLISAGLNFSLISFFFCNSFPANFGYDSFDNLRATASYSSSQFIGDVYYSIVSVFFQFFPEPWIISILNLFVIFLCLNGLAQLSIKWNKWWVYFLSVILFFGYPVNILMSTYSVRDITASWIFAYLLIELYDLYLAPDESFGRKLKIFFLMIMTCCLRQEALYIIPPALIFLSFIAFRRFLIPATVISALTLALITLTKIVDDHPRVSAIYKTTLFINPLSYILKHKYPDGLPEDVNKKLGYFFKNDYLITYQSDYEIYPFHFGGINQDSTDADFIQFKKAAWDIFLENPGLLLKNRATIAGYMLGFKPDFNYSYSDTYFDAIPQNTKLFDQIKQQLAFSPQQRPALGRYLSPLIHNFNYNNRPVTNSYLFTLLLLVFSIIYNRKSSIYMCILGILLLRTLLVMAIAPAGYFKYLYPLMIFVPFALPILLADKQLRLTKVGPPFKTL